jgi:hypothetical protein
MAGQGEQEGVPRPWQTIEEREGVEPARSDWRSDPARPLVPRAKVAVLLLAAVAIAAAVALYADIRQLDLLDRAVAGERIPLAEATDSDDRVAMTATVYLIALILSMVTFLLWYSRAYRNIVALGVPNPRYGPRWAIAYWFIPIVNLFRPKQVMNDIWRGSDPELDRGAQGWEHGRVAPLLLIWWVAWLLTNFVARFATSNLGDQQATAQELRDAAQAYVVSDVFDIVSALLAIAVVVAVTKRQQERIRRIEDGVDQPAAADSLPAPSPAS